jgi:hypothetical protein
MRCFSTSSYIKFHIWYQIHHRDTPSTKFGVEIFDRVAWAFGLCIAVWPYLRPVLTIDTGFLLGRYAKLFIAYTYDAEQQLLPLAFTIVAGEKSIAKWDRFMQ